MNEVYQYVITYYWSGDTGYSIEVSPVAYTTKTKAEKACVERIATFDEKKRVSESRIVTLQVV